MMKNEITVRILCDYDTLEKKLKENHFKKGNSFILDDVYLIQKTVAIEQLSFDDILKRCLILRKNNDSLKIVYKEKEYANNGSILDQKDFNFDVHNLDNVLKLFEQLNYKVLLKVHDECQVYSNDKYSLITQWVNQSDLYIEMENTSYDHDYEFQTIEEMIVEFKKLHLPYDDSDYFVSKAQDIYEK